jgi:hypothetical protein
MSVEDKWDKVEGDLLKNYWKEIENSDGILVVNITKSGIENYIGGNALIEMAFAHILDKRIFLLNPIPKQSYSDEIEAMNPRVVQGDLSQIGS